MALITKAVKGTNDILPDESYERRFLEDTLLSIARDFGFNEMRTPVFEHTELFTRSVGETTDVVQKEMYTFDDKGGRSITLRPEGTAGMARAYLENGLHNTPLPVKVSYVTSCYRYERPQSGRYREFNQFGVECFGTPSPVADAEVISLADTILSQIGIIGVSLHINSIGCPKCRPDYHKALKDYFEGHKAELCPTCLDRLDRNPMRILDCKSPVCAEISKDAPVMIDFLCDECETHFDTVKTCLDSLETAYQIDTKIVRGLDYYTRTVFEFISDALGSQAVVCGGGRYDGLIEELGGQHTPSLGFGMGIERLIMVMKAKSLSLAAKPRCDIYFAPLGEKAAISCFTMATSLRKGGVNAECDVVGRSLKAQMKYANKIGARYVVVVGDDELESGSAKLKDMDSGEETDISLDDGLYSVLYNKSLDRELAGMTDLFNSSMETSGD